MARREFGVLAVMVVVAGMVGGAGASLLLHGTPAIAQGSDAASAPRASVTARAFVLVDASGKERAGLRVHDDGAVRLTMLDPAGKQRAIVSVTKSGMSTVMLCDEADNTRVGIMARSDGSPAVALLDSSGQPRASLQTRRDGAPSLSMWDASSKTIWSAP